MSMTIMTMRTVIRMIITTITIMITTMIIITITSDHLHHHLGTE